MVYGRSTQTGLNKISVFALLERREWKVYPGNGAVSIIIHNGKNLPPLPPRTGYVLDKSPQIYMDGGRRKLSHNHRQGQANGKRLSVHDTRLDR
ncbi:hypothetical protein BaRGS_00029770 [Batillaria attramentaria]|uniref:Uncharacterized protein n=1 Tax=Batillaria attramentaria TaxID=370345 RepID=A0ABD0JWB5_9CAEN